MYHDEEIEFDENFRLDVNRLSQDSAENSNSDLLVDLRVSCTVQGELELKDYTSCTIKLSETCPFTVVTDSTGKETVVRKSSICWLLNEFTGKLSSDRLLRVRQLEYESFKSNDVKLSANFLDKCDEINIDDWTIFNRIDSHKCLVGLVLGFGYLSGTTGKTKEYSSTFAKIRGNQRDVGVSCQWFGLTNSGYLSLINTFAHGYIDIKKYKFTVSAPTIFDVGLRFTENIYIKIKDLI